MCKARDYVNQILDVCNQINFDYDYYEKEEFRYNALQQDFLHKIEDANFNAVEGYYLAKELKELRVARRKVKNELHNLSDLKSCVNSLQKGINSYSKTLKEKETKQEHPVYNLRAVTETHNGSNNKLDGMIKDFKKEQRNKNKYKYA